MPRKSRGGINSDQHTDDAEFTILESSSEERLENCGFWCFFFKPHKTLQPQLQPREGWLLSVTVTRLKEGPGKQWRWGEPSRCWENNAISQGSRCPRAKGSSNRPSDGNYSWTGEEQPGWKGAIQRVTECQPVTSSWDHIPGKGGPTFSSGGRGGKLRNTAKFPCGRTKRDVEKTNTENPNGGLQRS